MLRQCLATTLVFTLAVILSPASTALAQKGDKGGGGKGGGDNQPTYTFSWLGTLGGPYTRPGGINDRSDVWGASEVSTGDIEYPVVSHPFIVWAEGPVAGQMFDFQQQLIDEGWIGEFNWEAMSGVLRVEIGEINNNGSVALIIEELVDFDSGYWRYSTCLYKPASVDEGGNIFPSSLETIDQNLNNPYRVHLNDAGVVASRSYFSLLDGSTGTYQWTPESGRVYLGFDAEPWSINLGGSMCGPYGDWKYTAQDGFSVVFPSGDFGWRSSVRKINNFNQIGGTYQRSDTSTPSACRIESDGTINLIKMPKSNPSIGYGINNNGDVVGSGYLNGGYRPFVYTEQDGVIDVFESTINLPAELKSLIDGNGSTDTIGYFDINDSGQVVGRVFGSDDERAFLVTPN